MASQFDAVCIYLTSLWQAAPALADVQVVDSAQVNSDPSPDWLFVGADGGEPTSGTVIASIPQAWMAFNKVKQEGPAPVTCAVVSLRGDTDIPTARARAIAILSAAEDALRADYTLGGLVMQSYLSGFQYMPAQTTTGAKVRIPFTVTYQAQL